MMYSPMARAKRTWERQSTTANSSVSRLCGPVQACPILSCSSCCCLSLSVYLFMFFKKKNLVVVVAVFLYLSVCLCFVLIVFFNSRRRLKYGCEWGSIWWPTVSTTGSYFVTSNRRYMSVLVKRCHVRVTVCLSMFVWLSIFFILSISSSMLI